MKFLTDENLGFGVINPLRRLGFDIKSILEVSSGLEDAKVLSLANNEGRILITADKDFGELVYLKKLSHKGVILLRLKKEKSSSKLKILLKLFKERLKELEGAFTVVTENRIKIRKFHTERYNYS